MLWVKFNNNGQFIGEANVGSLPFAGTDEFQIFAVFEDINLDNYGSASIKLYKPDLSLSSDTALSMVKESIEFDGTTNDYFTNGTTYTGFYFDFRDYSNEDGSELLDTTGLWRAVITLLNVRTTTLRNVVGSVTFNVGNGNESEESGDVGLDSILTAIYAQLGTKLNITSPNYIKAIESDDIDNFPFEDAYNEGDVVLNRTDLKLYQLDSNKEPVFVFDLGKQDIKVVDTLPINTTGYEEGIVVFDLSTKSIYKVINSSFSCVYSFDNIVELTSAMGSLTTEQYEKLQRPNGCIKYNSNYYYKETETTFARYSFEKSSGGAYNHVVKQYFTISSNSYSYAQTTLASSYEATYLSGLLNNKQDRLVSGTNIKTINGQSILGSGDLPIQGGGGSAEWGAIGGDIQDQTDLQDELQDIREVAEGKANTFVLSYNDTLSSVKSDIAVNSAKVYDIDGNDITSAVLNGDYDTYFASGNTFANPLFDSQNDSIGVSSDGNGNVFIFRSENKSNRFNSGYIICYTNGNVFNAFNIGDNFYIIETLDSDNETLPDRWLGSKAGAALFYKLETGKIDLSAYATKTEVAEKSDLSNIAPAYDSTVIYSIGDKVINEDGELVTCLVNMTQAEEYDSTHWEQVSVASGFVDLDKKQVITGNKTMQDSSLSFKFQNGTIYSLVNESNQLKIKYGTLDVARFGGYKWYFYGDILPQTSTLDIGGSGTNQQWKDLYLSGKAYIGTANIYTNNTNIFFQLISGTDAFAMYGSAFVGVNGNKSLGTNATRWDTIWGNNYRIGGSMTPTNNNTSDLGNSSNKFKDLYLGGKINDNAYGSGYGITVPDTTGWTANKELATTDQAFNVINVADMTDNNHFTADQITLLSNGKPTRIIGNLNGNRNNVFITSIQDSGTYLNAVITYANSDTDKGLSYIQITKANGFANVRNNLVKFGNNRIDINTDNGTDNSIYLNGKKLPNHPSNTGTFVLKCVDGTLTWVAE